MQCEESLTFSLPEATRRRFRSSRGVSGRSRVPFSVPRGGLGEPVGAPGPPLGSPRGAPGMLQDALGCLPGAPGSSGRAPGAILGRFWVPRGASRAVPGRFFIASPLSHADKSAEPAVRLLNISPRTSTTLLEYLMTLTTLLNDFNI